MKRFFFSLASFIIVLMVAISFFAREPERAQAGGWPCFLCHGGFDVPGTDIAPALAGSKLTDEQILAQVRNPRGVMPAFSKAELPDQVIKDGFIQPFVRGLPAGKPTATLSAADRSAALATIAAVAAARATQVLESRPASNAVAATPPPSLQSSPTLSPALPSATPRASANNQASANTTPDESSPVMLFGLASGVLIVIGLFVWWLRR